MDTITKEAYQARGSSSPNSPDLTTLPLQAFFDKFQTQIIKGSLKRLLSLCNDTAGENFVDGFAILNDCLWPLLIRSVETTLSFVTSTANLGLFQNNYRCCEAFVRGLTHEQRGFTQGEDLL